MFNRKSLRLPRVSQAKLRFSNFSGGINSIVDEHLLPQRFATEAYNFKSFSGALLCGDGISEFALPHFDGQLRSLCQTDVAPIRVWHYKRYDLDNAAVDDRLIFLSQDMQLYQLKIYSDQTQLSRIEGVTFKSVPTAINYRLYNKDVIIFCSPSDDMVVYDGDTTDIVYDAPKITSMCIHYERLFATVDGERVSLWFSENLDPTSFNVDIDGAGFIDMLDERGILLKVVSFADYLFVFRTNGITKVAAYGDQTQFSVSSLFVSSGRILPDTVCVCGDRIMFLATDGLYTFDGYSTYKTSQNSGKLFEGIDNQNAVAAYLSGKYYLSCNLNFSDGIDSALVVFDIAENTTTVCRGLNICYLTAINATDFSKLAVCTNDGCVGEIDGSGKYFGEPLAKLWKTPKSNLGHPDRIKCVKDLYIISKQDATVTVSADNKVKRIAVKGSALTSKYRVDVSGLLVGMTIESQTDNPYITQPMITIDVL